MSNEISVGFIGDIHLGETLTEIDPLCKKVLSQVDLMVGNLETPFASFKVKPGNKPIPLHSSSANCSVLKELGVNVVSLANNHFCDAGEQGVDESLKLLKGNDIQTVGAGKSHKEAVKPCIISMNGFKVGLISAGELAIDTVQASEEKSGCSVIHHDFLKKQIITLRLEVDYVVVNLHWGLTNYHYPTPEQVKWGKEFIDAGASVIVGHHPHVIQGYEAYKNGLIFYSLGNFLFKNYKRKDGRSGHLSKENRYGILVAISFSDSGVSLKEIKFTEFCNDNKVMLCSDSVQKSRQLFFEKLSKNLGLNSYSTKYKRYLIKRILTRILFWLSPYKWKDLNAGHLRSLNIALLSFLSKNSRVN